MKLKKQLVQVILLFIGLTIAHFGVTLFLLANLGSDPFNVLVQGIFRRMQDITHWGLLTHGRVHMAISVIIILVLLVIDRSYIKIGTVLCMFCGGPIIDLFTLLLRGILNSGSPMWWRLVSLALGCVILAFGMTIVIKSECGTGPNDLVAVVLSDKLKKPFSILRVCVDVVFLGAGFLMGGVFGIGSVICAALVGPVAGFFMPISQKIVRAVNEKAGVIPSNEK